MRYRRAWKAGGTFFFTVNLADRRSDLLVRNVPLLRDAFRQTRARHPFHVDAIVILPDHLHAIWTLPADDADFARRWSLIKAAFSRALPKKETISESRNRKGERGIWQRRFWEHRIRNEDDFTRHVDYIHWNPVKHEWSEAAVEWPYSSIHRFIRRGDLLPDWGGPQRVDTGSYGER